MGAEDTLPHLCPPALAAKAGNSGTFPQPFPAFCAEKAEHPEMLSGEMFPLDCPSTILLLSALLPQLSFGAEVPLLKRQLAQQRGGGTGPHKPRGIWLPQPRTAHTPA